MNARTARLITFEGGEGAGKSTQVRMLSERLTGVGVSALVTREPGGSPHAEALRAVLLSGFARPLGPEGEALLFAAARIDHMDNTIGPALAAGTFVLCDRFIDSTLVYQGATGRVDGRLIAALERLSIGTRRPDLTFVVDLPPEIGLARAARRRGHNAPDRFEGEDSTFHATVRDAYRAIADEEPERVVIVDGTLSQDALSERIWQVVRARFDLLAIRAA